MVGRIVCDVLMRRVGLSGHSVLAEGVTEDRASEIISSQPPTPGYVVWRVDRTESDSGE